MVIHGVCGIHDKGENTVNKFLTVLREEGFKSKNANLPYRFALFTYFSFLNRRYGKLLASQVDEGDWAIGHSHGCLVIYNAMMQGAKFDTVILFAPAMETEIAFPIYGAKNIHIIYNPYDLAILIGSLIPFHHPFGRLGNVGYKGCPDDRVFQRGIISPEAHLFQHSKLIFSEPYFTKWVVYILNLLKRKPLLSSSG